MKMNGDLDKFLSEYEKIHGFQKNVRRFLKFISKNDDDFTTTTSKTINNLGYIDKIWSKKEENDSYVTILNSKSKKN